MTVNNIANMAVVCGLDAIALTDHNSLKNCPPFFAACARAGVLPVAGVEVCTREEVHVLCYFPDLGSGMAFDEFLDSKLAPVLNRASIFGRQILLGDNDEEAGEEARLLVAAADVGIDDLPGLAARHGGVAVPAHIDRSSNGLIANLGFVPAGYPFRCYELRDPSAWGKLLPRNPGLLGARLLHSSDAHSLADIQERGRFIEAGSRDAGAIIAALKEKKKKKWTGGRFS
jgi:hypothetical protein